MTAADVIYLKHCWYEDMHGYPGFWDTVFESMRNPSVGDPLIPRSASSESVLNNWIGVTSVAENFYVSHDMMRLAMGASEALDDDVTVQRQSLPADNGFIVFGAPFRTWDIRGRVLTINAALWGVRGSQVHVVMLVDKYDPTERMAISAGGWGGDWNSLPRLSPLHVSRFDFGQELPATMQMVGHRPIPPEVTVNVRVDNGAVIWSADDEGLTSEGMHATVVVDPVAKLLTAVWRLMRQTLVAVEREEATDKRSRRLAEKHLRGDRHVTIIRLRRTEYHGKGDRVWSLDHRVLVRGHWRRQWYGSGDARWQDMIYIHPHIRGPEGAPLVMTDTVNALVR